MSIRLMYLGLIRQNCTSAGYCEEDLEYWRNKLFCATLMYVLPLSLIALIPGLYWIWQIGAWALGVIDLLMVGSLFIVALAPGIKLVIRKVVFITAAYTFSFALLYYVGTNGPGLTYLLACCIFSILIFSTKHAYWPAWLNTGICVLFWLIIILDMMPPGDPRNNNPGEWIAIATNLIFLSFLCAALIPRLFKGLQLTLEKEVEVKRELHIQKQRFVGLFMESPICMGVISGPEHVFEITNPPYLELIGRTNVIGKSVKEVLPNMVEQGIVGILDSIYKSGETFSAREMLLELEIGGKISSKYISFSYQPHRGKDQQVDSILFFAIDVTEQVLSRRTIEISEMRLAEAQSIGMMGNWEVDLVNNTHYWSDEVYKIFGVSKDAVQPNEESFMAFVHPDDLEYAYSQIRKGFETLENITFYFRFIRSDGIVRHGYNEWKFKFDKDGEPLLLTGILQDVTARKEAEEGHKNSEAFNKGVLDALTSHVAVIDFSGNLIAVNESWEHYGAKHGLNTLQGTGIGRNYFEACETAEKNGVAYAAAAAQGIRDVMHDKVNIFYHEYHCLTPSENGWFGMRVMKFHGEQPYIVIVHHNISGRKSAEFDRTKATQDLMRRNKDLEQFTYIVSHNLRAPVANILGLVNIWNSQGLAEDERNTLSQALYDSVNKLDEVVKDLNQILQIRDEMTERNESVSFTQLVEDIKVSIKSLIDMDFIEIEHDFSATDNFLTIKSYLYSVFYNLITNSIKYRQAEIPCVIKIKSHLNGNKLELTFKDNSMGIDMEKRGEQVFGLYKRFHSHVEGKGLGLFMVKAQVEKLGGKISVSSEVNKGTEFRIEFDL